MRDPAVRSSHSALEGKIRNFFEFPAPGEEPNCRCWGEMVKKKKKKATGLRQELTSEVNDSDDKWDVFDFAYHFALGGGNPVILTVIGYLGDVISVAEQAIYKNLEDQVADKMRNIKSGPLGYRTSNGYQFSSVHWVLGKLK